MCPPRPTDPGRHADRTRQPQGSWIKTEARSDGYSRFGETRGRFADRTSPCSMLRSACAHRPPCSVRTRTLRRAKPAVGRERKPIEPNSRTNPRVSEMEAAAQSRRAKVAAGARADLPIEPECRENHRESEARHTPALTHQAAGVVARPALRRHASRLRGSLGAAKSPSRAVLLPLRRNLGLRHRTNPKPARILARPDWQCKRPARRSRRSWRE